MTVMSGRFSNRIGAILLVTVLSIGLTAGCVRQNAWLSYAVPETMAPTATPRETPAPTREPVPLTVEPIQGEAFHTDRKGIPILDSDTHYFTYYLSFSDMRVYEEDGYTYMDGICTNSFDGTLTGRAQLCFYDADEKLVGFGDIHTADGELLLTVGTNRIYAEILSEVDVQQLTCRIEQVSAFNPV